MPSIKTSLGRFIARVLAITALVNGSVTFAGMGGSTQPIIHDQGTLLLANSPAATMSHPSDHSLTYSDQSFIPFGPSHSILRPDNANQEIWSPVAASVFGSEASHVAKVDVRQPPSFRALTATFAPGVATIAAASLALGLLATRLPRARPA